MINNGNGKLKKIKNFLIVSIVSLLFLANTTSITSIEDNLEEATLAEAISVKYTQTEINRIETTETTNPRRPYVLGFVSERFAPTQKLDNKLQSHTPSGRHPLCKMLRCAVLF